jgi:hypothetical protein
MRLFDPLQDLPRRLRLTIHRRYLVASLSLYVTLLLALLISSGFVPYVTDNNESFSAAIHARNMVGYGLGNAMGLADEATSASRAAHPYVYTHGGNFPRLPVYLITRLGLARIEWQIVALSLAIGSATVYLCFGFFSTIGDDLLAFLVSSVFVTDYVLFMEWEGSTYRVWHGLLFFAGLVCIQRIGRQQRRLGSFFLFLTAVALGYFEIVFATFTVLTWVMYALFAYWHQLRVVARVALFSVAGILGAVLTLFAQSVALFGWITALEDIRLTFLVRNFLRQSFTSADTDRTLAFFQQHHIVYWIDNPDTRGYLHLDAFLRTVGTDVLQIHTPFLVLLMWVTTAAWMIKMGWRIRMARARARVAASTSRQCRGAPQTKTAIVTTFAATVVMLYAVVSLATNDPSRMPVASYGGLPGFPAQLFAPKTATTVAAVLLLLWAVYRAAVRAFAMRVVVRRHFGFVFVDARQAVQAAMAAVRDTKISARELVLAAILLAVIAGFELNYWQFFNIDFAALWLRAIEGFFGPPLLEAAVVGFIALGLLLVLRRGRNLLRARHDAVFIEVLRYLTAGGIAFGIVYLIFPGYLAGGYLVRQAPLPVFIVDVWVALFFYALANIVVESGRQAGVLAGRARDTVGGGRRVAVASPRFVFLLSAGLLIFGSAYWARAQYVYVETLPPTTVQGLRRELMRPTYAEATFISNNYPGLVTYYTRAWAYPDPTFNNGVVVMRRGALAAVIGGQYIWEADRDVNQAYTRPEYYLCLTMPSMYMARDVAGLPPGGHLSNCRSDPIVVDATQHVGPFFNVVAAEDPGRRGLWAIVRLDPAMAVESLH